MPDNKDSKKIYCSSGKSHFLICPNADVYRCITDYNHRNKPLFNAKNLWRPADYASECYYDSCVWCDSDWSMKWILKEGARSPLIIEPQSAAFGVYSFFAEQEIEKTTRQIAHILWYPTLTCNYTCAYCEHALGKHNIFKEFPSAYPELSVYDWIKIWDRIAAEYELGVVDISGGEPLLSEVTLPVIDILSEKFIINLTTNLSINAMKIARNIKPSAGDSVTKGFYCITASLHPTSKNFNKDLFLGSVLYLKKLGFKVTINFVGYPLQLFLAEEYKEWCNKYGIIFVVSPWFGTDKEGFKPNYTQIEQKVIKSMIPAYRKIDTQIDFRVFNHVFQIESDRIILEEGENFVLTGKVKNAGNFQWDNKNLKDEEAIKLGIKILSYANENKIIKEARAALPKNYIAPNDTCGFSINMDTTGLKKGVYFAKIDLLKEGAFWFEDKGSVPFKIRLVISEPALSSEFLLATIQNSPKNDKIFIARIKIRNTGLKEWICMGKENRIKIGCRVFGHKKIDINEIALKEFRAELPGTIKPDGILKTEMQINCQDLSPATYSLIFDMVNEGKFWFAERGSKPFVKEILIR